VQVPPEGNVVVSSRRPPREELFYSPVYALAVVVNLELKQAFVDFLAKFYRFFRGH
jgi:hypothetical protein